MPKSVLITGASGFVGANIVNKLIKLGVFVHALIRPNTDLWRLRNSTSDLLTLHTVQGIDRDEILPIFESISPYAVIHCAAAGIHPEERNENELIQTNIQGTMNLLQAATASHVRRFIHTGSCFEFESNVAPIDEGTAPFPQNFYGVTKAASTLLAMQQGRALGIPTVALRLFGLYGPLESQSRFLPTVIHACKRGEKVDMTPGEQIRDYTYIEDVAELYAQLILSDFFPEDEIFHVGSGQPCTIRKFGSIVETMMGRKNLLNWGGLKYRSNEAHVLVSNPSKIYKIFGWQATTSLEDGIRSVLLEKVDVDS